MIAEKATKVKLRKLKSPSRNPKDVTATFYKQEQPQRQIGSQKIPKI